MYGADAVFVGGKEFSLRSQASNFSIEDIKEGVILPKNMVLISMLHVILFYIRTI